MKKKRSIEKIGYDLETLKRWKYSSTKAKLEWLEAAIEFANATRRAKD